MELRIVRTLTVGNKTQMPHRKLHLRPSRNSPQYRNTTVMLNRLCCFPDVAFTHDIIQDNSLDMNVRIKCGKPLHQCSSTACNTPCIDHKNHRQIKHFCNRCCTADIGQGVYSFIQTAYSFYDSILCPHRTITE